MTQIDVERERRTLLSEFFREVLESNDEHHFIVIDQGSMDGVRVGMVFDLLRGETPVGRAAAVRVPLTAPDFQCARAAARSCFTAAISARKAARSEAVASATLLLMAFMFCLLMFYP